MSLSRRTIIALSNAADEKISGNTEVNKIVQTKNEIESDLYEYRRSVKEINEHIHQIEQEIDSRIEWLKSHQNETKAVYDNEHSINRDNFSNLSVLLVYNIFINYIFIWNRMY